ncbi:glycosyltransferase, partial [Bacillus cereus group sp. BC6]
YRIKFQAKAVTWEQEPQTLPVWFKQRSRWAKGNIYVILKNVPLLFKREGRRVRFDILYFLSIYFLLLTSLIVSDVLLVLYALGLVHTTL